MVEEEQFSFLQGVRDSDGVILLHAIDSDQPAARNVFLSEGWLLLLAPALAQAAAAKEAATTAIADRRRDHCRCDDDHRIKVVARVSQSNALIHDLLC